MRSDIKMLKKEIDELCLNQGDKCKVSFKVNISYFSHQIIDRIYTFDKIDEYGLKFYERMTAMSLDSVVNLQKCNI